MTIGVSTTNQKAGRLKAIARTLLLVLCAFCTLSTSAQTRKITGTVKDEAGDPMVGVTVMIKGTSFGTSTDANGDYSINAKNGATLEFSYIGYLTQTVTLGERSVINVTMKEDIKALDEVVVIAYGTASKESLTGSVAVISDKDIQSRPVTSVTSALEGKAPGVQVNGSTGTPGESPSILIRGINSVNGTTAPLYVVDGVVWSGNYNDLNPNDVETISVLKDAASCALYGSKGANGVVLITTKRAKNAGNVEVTAKIRQGIYQRALPEYRRLGYDRWNEAMLQGIANGKVTSNPDYTYAQAMKETIGNFFSEAGVLNLYDVYEVNADGTPVLDPEGHVIRNITGLGDQVFDQNGHIIAKRMSQYDDTDWWDAISRNGHRQEYNVSGVGATDKFNVFASFGYVKEKGYLLKTDFERWNGRLNAEFRPTKFLKMGIGVNAADITSNQPQFDTDNLSSTSNAMSYQGIAPGLPYYAHDWQTGAILRDETTNKPIWNTMDGYPAFTSNRAYILRANSEDYNRLAVDGNAFATIYLPYNFELTVRGTMNRYRQESTGYDSPEIGSAQNFGRLAKTFYKRQTHNFQQTLYWQHEYGAHHVDALLSHESYNRYYEYTSLQNKNELFPNKYFMSNFTENESTGAYAYRYRTETYLGRARYNYNNHYFLEASLSRDASSKFSKDNRWGTFWSVGASWIISKEKFLQDIEQIDQLKLRAAYGTAGNDYTSNYYPTYDLWSKYSHTLDGNASVVPSTLGNENIKWESTKTLDLALEGYFFNSRLNASVGFFSRVNADLLYNVQQAISNGTDGDGAAMKQWQNVGDMRNTGWEIMLSGDIIRTKGLAWTAHIDASFIKNKITKLPAGNQFTSPRALIEGKSRYEYYMPKWAGVDMLTGQSLYEINDCYKFQSEDPETGEWKLNDEKWESNLTNAEAAGALVKIGDRYYTTSTSFASNEFCGSSLPKVFGSFGTDFTWKGLTVSALFTYSLGGKTLDTVYAGMLSPNSGKSLHEDAINNTWQPEMAEGITDENRINPNIRPQLNNINASNNNSASTSRFLTSSDYLAFKNLNVNYEIPKKWSSLMSLRGLNVGMSIDNVKLWTKRDGMNPTYSNAGGQGEYFVPSRVISFELTARF
ncbi:MAG: SusC/RagA family TonB-linked outer membrane protein [Muribaculum sp.]|nr:SusC/RagA family TonB-linked outer membrane protein [Muribaculum sp.]